MSEMDKDRALERVRKMLALANDAGASEGERDNAMRMAHATLAKHNLSLVDVDASSGSEKRVDLGHETLCWPWMRVTANGIAELFFCKYFSVKTRKNYVKHYFVGRLSNATTASELSQYVIKSISKEAARAKSDEPFAGSDFVLSFAKVLRTRCIAAARSFVRMLSASPKPTPRSGRPAPPWSWPRSTSKSSTQTATTCATC